jgi:CARDB
MKLNTFMIAFVVLGCSLQSTQSVAWEQITCEIPFLNAGKKKHWTVKQYKPVFDSMTIPLISAQYTALTDATARMNLNPSSFRYASGGLDNRDGVGVLNNESEIWFEDLTKLNPMNAKLIAVERSDSDLSRDCTATESDIRINTKYRLARKPVGGNKIQYNLLAKNQLFEYGGSYENFTSTVMHEMGHSAGLDHEGDVMNLMGGDNLIVANGNAFNPYIGEDTAGGLIALYGLSTTAKEEVGVSHWRLGTKKSDGAGGFYSVHFRTRMFNAAGVELPKVCPYAKPNLDGPPITLCPEPIYKVTKGQAVKLELTYENAGKTPTRTATVRYYLSTDSTISPTDTLLKTTVLSFLRNNTPSTFSTALVIPNTAIVLRGKNYWLGAIVDPTNLITESFEGNNATYVGIKTN